MNTVALGDVCQVMTGQSAPQDADAFGSIGVPFVRAGSLERLCAGDDEDSLERIPPDKAAKYRLKIYPADTVIFPKSGMSAKVGRVYRLRRDCHLVSHLAAVLPSDKVSAAYLHRWFEYSPPSNLIENNAYPSIKTSTLQKIHIPLPPLTEQRRIATILDKADSLRAKRRNAITKLDQLLQSVFLDIFGDPVSNSRAWPIQLLGNLCDVRDGTHDSPKYVETGYPLVTSKNLVSGRVNVDGAQLISGEDFASINKRSKVDRGDLLMPMIGTIGNPVLVDCEPNYAIKNIALIKFGRTPISNIYILHLLKSNFFDVVTAQKNRGGSQKFLALRDIRAMQIPVPDSRSQVKFNWFVETIGRQKLVLQRSAEQLASVFASLQHRAFSGTL